MKEDLRGIITIIDISKAFDTVPYREISKELEIKGVPISEYIQNMYKGCKIIIYCRDKTLPVDILKGIKGDILKGIIAELAVTRIFGKIKNVNIRRKMRDIPY